jgi:hypothetical protein
MREQRGVDSGEQAASCGFPRYVPQRPRRIALALLLAGGLLGALLANALASTEMRGRILNALRRLRRPHRRPAAEPVAPQLTLVEPEAEREPLAELFDKVSRPGYREHEVDGVGVLLPESEEIEPEVLQAVEELAAEQEARRPEPARSRRRWAAVAAVAALLCGAGALAAVSWAIWDPDQGNGGSAGAEAVAPSGNAAILAAVSRPSAKEIPVAGAKGRLVLVVAPDGKAALIVSDLTPAPRDKQYEAWVIPGKTPQRAGLFTGGPGSVVVPLQRPVPKGATVAVTLERVGGVAAPTRQPIFAAKRV